MQILHDPQGAGIVMSGGLTGAAASAQSVLLAVFAYSPAFDPTPVVRLALADKDDRDAQALFTATVHGAPVVGVAVAALGDAGGDVSIFYDYPDAFAASFARLQQAFAQSSGNTTVALSPLHLADGNQIGAPPGWRIAAQGQGFVELHGPQGEIISLGAAIPVYTGDSDTGGDPLQAPCCDPVAAFRAVFPQLAAIEQRLGGATRRLGNIVEAQPSPAPNGAGAFILSKVAVGGEPYSYLAVADAVAGFADPWTFSLSGAMAPQAVFATELPTLLQIWRSYSADPPGFAERLQQALQSMAAMQQMLQATAIARATRDYNADAAWDPLIRAVGAALTTGSQQVQLNDALAKALVDKLTVDTGRPWRLVSAAAPP